MQRSTVHLVRTGVGSLLHRVTPSSWTARRWNSQHRVILLPEIPVDDASSNPILKSFKDDIVSSSSGFPNLSNVSERNCYFGLGKSLLEFESAVCQMEDKCRAGVTDFDALFVPLEEAKCQIESVWNTVNLLHIATDALDRDRFTQLHRRAERAFLTRHGSRTIHSTLLKMKEEHATGKKLLDAEQLRILERYLLEYRHQGFELSEKKYMELNTSWMVRLNESRRDYNFRITSATQRFSTTIKDPNVVRDFPLDVLKAMAVDSSQPTKGPWTASLHPYIHRKFMEYCPERKLRWNVFQADVARGSRSADVYLDVSPQIKSIRQHRFDQAATLGFQNYADMSMETKMAANVENVHSMIASLLGKAREAQELELESLQSFAEARGFEDNLAAYDVHYFKRKQKRTNFGIISEDLRDFFPLPRVVTAVFRLCQDLFDIKIEEVKDNLKVWAPDIKLFRVIDSNTKVLGHFYFDPYIRDDKGYSGPDKGWYIPIRSHSPKVGSLPLGAMVLSFPTPGYGKPSLLNFEEVQELLKNVGSMLMHMLSTSSWSDLSGKSGVAWDALDVASNFMTHWLFTPSVLSTLSGHWSSNEPLSQKVVDSLCMSNHHMAGYELCQELFKAAYDISFYSEDYNEESHDEIVNRLHPQYLLLPLGKENGFPSHFSEILGGDHSAAYYCHTWAKMLAADVFSSVQEVGLENAAEVKKVTRRFRSTFLSLGSSVPAAEIFRQFRGRDPSHEALLLSLGLKEITKPKKKGLSQEVVA